MNFWSNWFWCVLLQLNCLLKGSKLKETDVMLGRWWCKHFLVCPWDFQLKKMFIPLLVSFCRLIDCWKEVCYWFFQASFLNCSHFSSAHQWELFLGRILIHRSNEIYFIKKFWSDFFMEKMNPLKFRALPTCSFETHFVLTPN